MFDLKNTSPEIYEAFMTGNYTPRQSDRLWAGLSTDLCIEKFLMRNIISVGGLTHGRGMEELKNHNVHCG